MAAFNSPVSQLKERIQAVLLPVEMVGVLFIATPLSTDKGLFGVYKALVLNILL